MPLNTVTNSVQMTHAPDSLLFAATGSLDTWLCTIYVPKNVREHTKSGVQEKHDSQSRRLCSSGTGLVKRKEGKLLTNEIKETLPADCTYSHEN